MSQVWFITGGSRGLGRAVVNEVLAAGHAVVTTTRTGVLDDVDPAVSDRLLVVPLDVTDSSQAVFDDAVAAAVARFGRLDVLVNNAGHGTVVQFEETDEALLRGIFETNVFGLMRVTRAVLPVFREQRGGHVINISSVAGYVGGNAAYSSTKFAVTGFSESLAFELSPFGISVTNVAPGFFRTDFLAPAPAAQVAGVRQIEDYDASRAAIAEFATQMNRNQPGDPAALARLLVEAAQTDAPPLHLIIGADAVDQVEARGQQLAADIDTWRDRSAATALPTE